MFSTPHTSAIQHQPVRRVVAAGLVALYTVGLTACSGQADLRSESGRACHDSFVAEIAPSAQGQRTRTLAAQKWAEDSESRSDAPTAGWVTDGASSARSGDWQVELTETAAGGWVVYRLTCL